MSKPHEVVEKREVEDSPNVVSAVLDIFAKIAGTFEDPTVVEKGAAELELLVKGTSLEKPPVDASGKKLLDALKKLQDMHVDHDKKMVVVAQAVHAHQALEKIIPPQPV